MVMVVMVMVAVVMVVVLGVALRHCNGDGGRAVYTAVNTSHGFAQVVGLRVNKMDHERNTR
jgi:ABC-type tungstate transport system substrate-binding protein